jgi:hypothetical protein
MHGGATLLARKSTRLAMRIEDGDPLHTTTTFITWSAAGVWR